MAKVYCKLNLRPRINGVPTLIKAGDSFDESVLDEFSAKELRRQGYLLDDGEFETVEEPAVEEPAVEEPAVEEPNVEEPAEVVEPAKPKPEGIWNFKRSEIQDMELDVLNAMGKKVANEHGQNFRAFQNKDSLLDKLCSEAAEA